MTAGTHALRGCDSCGLVSELPPDGTARCPRCGTPLNLLKPTSLQRSTAYLITSLVLYVPANLLPVLTTRSALEGEHHHTLLGGISQLWAAGSWELAVIVFAASIAVPLTKMVAMTLLIETALFRSTWRQRERATLYRMLDAIGHWSMLDVYVVVMLAGMVQFGAFGGVEAEPGLLAFGAVVVLTMLSVNSFDPRLIWPQDDEEERDDGRTG
jgi:paraquat-inducible protein A